MKDTIVNLLIKTLEETTAKLKAGTCEVTEEEASDIISVVAHIALNKEEACDHLHCSRATFDNAVRDKLLPKGIKRKHRKDLIWYKDQLINILKR